MLKQLLSDMFFVCRKSFSDGGKEDQSTLVAQPNLSSTFPLWIPVMVS